MVMVVYEQTHSVSCLTRQAGRPCSGFGESPVESVQPQSGVWQHARQRAVCYAAAGTAAAGGDGGAAPGPPLHAGGHARGLFLGRCQTKRLRN